MEKEHFIGDNFNIPNSLFEKNSNNILLKGEYIGILEHNMPKRTFQPHTRHRARTHGFRARVLTKAGRAVIKRRRVKGRAKLTA